MTIAEMELHPLERTVLMSKNPCLSMCLTLEHIHTCLLETGHKDLHTCVGCKLQWDERAEL